MKVMRLECEGAEIEIYDDAVSDEREQPALKAAAVKILTAGLGRPESQEPQADIR